MAASMQNGNGRGNGKRTRRRFAPVRVDITALIPVSCILLISFMTLSAFKKPTCVPVTESKVVRDKIVCGVLDDRLAVTILVSPSKEKIYYYCGKLDINAHLKCVDLSNMGLQKMLFDKNASVVSQINKLKGFCSSGKITQEQLEDEILKVHTASYNEPFVIVKIADDARYETTIKVFDALNTCDIARYSVADLSDAERIMMAREMHTEHN